MRCAGAAILASLFAFSLQAQQTDPGLQQVQVVECRDLSTTNNYLGPNETLITSTNTTPVSGSGTVTDNYGSTWNYSYDGQVTTTTTTTTNEDVPYTIESSTLYATAYDENGTMMSQHWHVYSTKQGGDAANSLGYNLGNALGAINAKGHLLNAVVKDIEGKKNR